MLVNDSVAKLLLKTAASESKGQSFECLASFVGHYPSSFIAWPSIWGDLMQSAVKQMEATRSNSILKQMFFVRLQESQAQGSLDVAFKTFNGP